MNCFNLFQRRYTASWHSFDRHPWQHPWLTSENLAAMREFSASIRREARAARRRTAKRDQRFGFICNVANSMYTSSKALQPHGADISLILHPGDDYIMSQPEWEEYDGEMISNSMSFKTAQDAGYNLKAISKVYRPTLTGDWASYKNMPPWVTRTEYYRWRNYYCFLPALKLAREFDSLFVIQAPYLAYLAKRPYLATHMGGDIWYECSRNDMLGHLQRRAFSQATLFIASNPWSYAFARRYGMRNMAFVPTLLNPTEYSPTSSSLRREWQQKIGGEFFVLTTARIDNFFKGSQIALEAFRQFVACTPSARLVLIGWGADLAAHESLVQSLGLTDRLIIVPPAGKKRIIAYLRAADCLLDQFVLGYFGMTALEALACGLPVIGRIEQKQYDAFLDVGCPPIINAATVEQILDALKNLEQQSENRIELANRSRQWFLRYSGNDEWAETYIDLLVAAASGHRFNFNASPLASRLNTEEVEYHRSELQAAPLFPNYT